MIGGFERAAGARPHILFSPKSALEPKIRRSLVDFTSAFLPFDTPGLDPDAYDIVVPLSLDWAHWLNRSASASIGAALRRKAIVPAEDVIALCDDKLAFTRLLAGNGFDGHVPRIGGDLGYPYVLKRRRDIWGQHTRVISTPAEEAACLETCAGGDWFRQQFVPGVNEYATHMLVSGRQIVFACTLEYHFTDEKHVHGHHQPPVGRAWVDHSHFYHLFARILGLLDYEGLCCIDYKLERGTPKIFEINPRMGGSLSYVANAAMRSYLNAVTRREARLAPEACVA